MFFLFFLQSYNSINLNNINYVNLYPQNGMQRYYLFEKTNKKIVYYLYENDNYLNIIHLKQQIINSI